MTSQKYIQLINNKNIRKKLSNRLKKIYELAKQNKVRQALNQLFDGLKVNPENGHQKNDDLLSIIAVENTSAMPFNGKYIPNNKSNLPGNKIPILYSCHLLSAYIGGTKNHLSGSTNYFSIFNNKQKASVRASNQQLEKLFKKYHCKYIVEEKMPLSNLSGMKYTFVSKLKYRLVKKRDLLDMLSTINWSLDHSNK